MSEDLTIPDPTKNFKDEFDNRIGRLTKSKAYLDYCEEVYGYRIYQFNMMDQEQLDYLFHAIPLSANDTILDLGCGSGSILSSLVEQYGCAGVGIDQIDPDFMQKSNKSIKFINGDVDHISDYQLNPTVTLSVDSLYFCKDWMRWFAIYAVFQTTGCICFIPNICLTKMVATRAFCKKIIRESPTS